MRLYACVFAMLVALALPFVLSGAEKLPWDDDLKLISLERGSSGTSLERIKEIVLSDNAVLKDHGGEVSFDMFIETVHTMTDERTYTGYNAGALVVYFNPFASDEPLLLRGEKKKTTVLIFGDKEQFAEYVPEKFRDKMHILESMRQWK
jgi:hypothetical protein